MSLLILGGTNEAHALARELAKRGIGGEVSLAGFAPASYDLPVRIGGFGGRDGQRAYLSAKGFSALIDASHPFSRTISQRSSHLCAELKLPYLRLIRPGFTETATDNWVHHASPDSVRTAITADARVLLAVGSRHLDDFAGLTGEIHLRALVPPEGDVPFPYNLLLQPPGTQTDETALMERLQISDLVCRNSGGNRAKLDAAADLGIRVHMIARPGLDPTVPLVETVAAALDWIAAHAPH